jgi:anion-transporting  ArsA/GET3 family ATPase
VKGAAVVLVCGPGGVGKTTVAAALAAATAAREELRVLVVTVDPARRLADALGITTIGNVETVVDPARFPTTPRGTLAAAMLDTVASWEDLVRRNAPDAVTADALLANPLYRTVTSRFAHSHDYLALERLHELRASGRYDLVVVDTPPSRSALDVLDAPRRTAEFFSSRLLRWLVPAGRSAAARPFRIVADRLLGARFVADVTEFFTRLATLEEGLVRRTSEIEATLRDGSTSFVVVTSAEAGPAAEAAALVTELGDRGLVVDTVVCNRMATPAVLDPDAREAARALGRNADLLATRIGAAHGADAVATARLLAEAGSSFADESVVAARQHRVADELAALARMLVRLPRLDGDLGGSADVTELGGLVALGGLLLD